MKLSLFVGAAVFGAFVLGAAHYMAQGLAARLDRGLTEQCLFEAWPAHQHEAHVAYCRENGKPVGLLR
jgi:hypothetical protein